jgi:hypothetical protein
MIIDCHGHYTTAPQAHHLATGTEGCLRGRDQTAPSPLYLR